jgi:hypothetical protein
MILFCAPGIGGMITPRAASRRRQPDTEVLQRAGEPGLWLL